MIPKKLKVFSTLVTINEVNGLTAEVGNLGQYSSIGNRIDIDSSLPEEIKMQTVLHEIIELVNHHLEIGIPEHRMITQLATALHQIIMENDLYCLPETARWGD